MDKEVRMKKIKIIVFMSIIYSLLLSLPNTALAGGIQGSQIFTGMQKLLEDLGKALIVIAPIAGGSVIAYCFIRRGAADEMDHKKWSNRITTALVSTIAATLSGAIITVVSGYFK